MAVEEYWDSFDAIIADPVPEFEAGDTVCFKDWPDFTYDVRAVDGDVTVLLDGMTLPTAALRKVDDHQEKVRKATREIVAAFAGVNHRLRDL